MVGGGVSRAKGRGILRVDVILRLIQGSFLEKVREQAVPKMQVMQLG